MKGVPCKDAYVYDTDMRLETDLTGLAAAADRKRLAEEEVLAGIYAARTAGASLRDIAKAAGLSHQRVHQIVSSQTTSAA